MQKISPGWLGFILPFYPGPSCFTGDIPKPPWERWWQRCLWHLWGLQHHITRRTFPVNKAGLRWFAKVENLILLLTTLKPDAIDLEFCLCVLPLEGNCMLCITVYLQTPQIITNLTPAIKVLPGTILYGITQQVGQRNNSSEQWEKLISLCTCWREKVERKRGREEYLVPCCKWS